MHIMSGIYSYTNKTDRIIRSLFSTVAIVHNGEEHLIVAKWDTGSTHTCIMPKVAEQLNLSPFSKATVSTISTEDCKESKAYKITIKIPNTDIVFHELPVVCALHDAPHFDILIGMDIITQGDFSVSNYNGKTVFSFRIPSQEEIDYTK